MRKPARVRSSDNDDSIDMTPMLDIVFIMLIFFIVTTSFIKEVGVPVEALAPSDPTTHPVTGMAVEIGADNVVRIKGRPVELALVSAHLQGVMAESPDEMVVVLASDASDAKTLVAVIDAVRQTGIETVSVGRLE